MMVAEMKLAVTIQYLRVQKFSRKQFIMPKCNTTPTLTKQRQVLNHLYRGWGIDSTEATKKYGVKNLRSTISSIRTLVEKYGNWEIITDSKGRYFMQDTHPGDRTYSFRKDGTRFMANA